MVCLINAFQTLQVGLNYVQPVFTIIQRIIKKNVLLSKLCHLLLPNCFNRYHFTRLIHEKWTLVALNQVLQFLVKLQFRNWNVSELLKPLQE